MKKAKDDKRLQTIPEGSYEAGAMNRELRKNNSREVNDLTTDAQGNGYPVPGNNKDGQSR